MKTTLDPKQAKDWFGTTPPDLSLVARSRAEVGKGSGADYLYTLWRTFYRDDTKPTGWNNLAFPDIAMPHALWQLQGERRAKFVEAKDPHEEGKTVHRFAGFEQITPGTLERPAVRRGGRRPGRLSAVDGRAGAGHARSHRRRRPDLPWPSHRDHLAPERGVLERPCTSRPPPARRQVRRAKPATSPLRHPHFFESRGSSRP